MIRGAGFRRRSAAHPGGRARRGGLIDVHPADRGATVLNALAEHIGIDPVTGEDVIVGCVTQTSEQASAFGRILVLASQGKRWGLQTMCEGAWPDVDEAAHGYGGIVFHDVINAMCVRKAIEKGADPSSTSPGDVRTKV